jgi:SnoaL-like domain
MNAIEVSQRSIDAWNRHDADALVAVYAEGGTYHTPRFDRPLTGKAIGDFAKSVWTAFPGSFAVFCG